MNDTTDCPAAAMPDMPGKPVGKGLSSAFESFNSLDLREQAALLTLPLLLLHVDRYWYVRVPIIVLGLAAVIFPAVRWRPACWFGLTAFLAAGIVYNWFAVDNHKYLLCYWCLALFFSLQGDDERAIAISARWLVGLTFLFATFWKIVSPDFRAGEFFEYAFFFDSRFSSRLIALGLADREMMEVNQAGLRSLLGNDASSTGVQLVLSPTLHRLALVFTAWAWVIEGLTALAFLAPPATRLGKLRHALLILFVASTYAFAPVTGFGWLLVTMGLVQCERSHRRTRLAYLGALFLVQAFRLPWPQILGV